MELQYKLKVILADEQKIVCQGLHAILERENVFDVIAEVDNGIEAIRLAEEISPDIVIIAISLHGMNGIELTRRIVEKMPNISVIIISMRNEKQFIVEALRAGAKGYLLKDCTKVELIAAIREIASGGTYLSQKVADLLVNEYVRQPSEQSMSTFSALTPKEKEVLRLIGEGSNTKEIAFLLHVSVKTIVTYRQNLMKKLNLHTIADLIKYTIRERLVSIEDQTLQKSS
jgi:DNA-binding NarL/FixJ family response regulator